MSITTRDNRNGTLKGISSAVAVSRLQKVCAHVFFVTYQTPGRVFHHDIQTPKSGSKNEVFF